MDDNNLEYKKILHEEKLSDFGFYVTCHVCQKKYTDSDFTQYECEDCVNKIIKDSLFDIFKEIFNEMHNHIKINIDGETNIGFSDEKEKEMFLRGVKRGMVDALFWFSEYYGKEGQDFFEKNISPIKALEIDYTLTDHDTYRCDKCNGEGFIKEE